MILTTGLIDFFPNQCRFVPRHALLPTTAAPMLASWFYQSLPFFSFVCYSFLHNCVRGNLQYAIMASVQKLVNTKLLWALLMLLFAWNVTKSVRSSSKQKVVIHHDWATHPLFWLITGEHVLTIKHSVFYITAGLIAEILLCCYPFIKLWDGLKISEYEAYWLMDFC